MPENHGSSHEPFASGGGENAGATETPAAQTLNAVAKSVQRKASMPRSPGFFSYAQMIAIAASSRGATFPAQVNRTASKPLPSFCPPDKSCLDLAVSDRVTLVLSTVTPPRSPVVATVMLHVYDLSLGLVNRHSQELLGFHVSGLYHSAVVCYGMEFFFGGGISALGAGRTRFGKKYETLLLGTTTKTLSEFMTWIRQLEEDKYHASAYHPIECNCHSFTNDAVTFLLGSSTAMPSFLFTTTEQLCKSGLGTGVVELLTCYSPYTNYIMNRGRHQQGLEQLRAAMSVTMSAAACALNTEPPPCVVLFRVDDPLKGRKAFESLKPYVEQLQERRQVGPDAKLALISAELIGAGVETMDPMIFTDYADLIVRILVHTHRTLWGPVLNSLRIALLHKGVLCACLSHPTFSGLLAIGARDFLNMTPDGKLALLRVLCNLSSSFQGALTLNSNRFAFLWVSVVGLALADYKNGAIVYTGATLAVDLAHAFVLTRLPQLSQEHAASSSFLRISRLVTVLLFYLQHWPQGRIPEATMNMMLLALFFLMSSSRKVVDFAANHGFRLSYDSMLKRAQTNESKALLALMHALERP
ncbi:uncharacterized protein Tco025E_06141 [Trypanosoma conorhini]|uniref:PPPDE domain-containing protein n=1 Tax=Trypanosoma conorhini TaxID=83891 RepID=A0A3R7P6J4_9TRYP|nr:uncharacterized protein Tco025E_06141 [Trypanosoma conorhini]RNF13552.1 hypothetical protein Tco025E_06141 [Trypanosoma conorhini]